MLAKYQCPFGPNFVLGLSPAAWFRAGTGITVTGSGVSQWDDQSGNARHLKQGTDANRPIALLHTGTNYLYLPGVASNNATSPDSVAASFTGDCDFIARLRLPDWTPSTTLPVIAKRGATNAWQLSVIATTGVIRLNWWDSGATLKAADSTSAPTVSDGGTLWIRATLDVDNGATGNDVIFYTSTDTTTDPDSVTWTKLGNTVTGAGTTTVRDTADQMLVGQDSGVTFARGDVFRVLVKSGIGGTTVVDFDPSRATDQASSFTASTGETWTINTSGANPAQIVASTRIMGDGTASKMAMDATTRNQPRTIYAIVQPISWTAADYIFSGIAAQGGVTQVTATPQIGLNAGSAAAANGDLTVGSKKVLCAVINGASSSLRVNNGTATTGNAGANNPGGLTLFSDALGSGYFNGMVWELIDFDAAHSTAQQDRVIQYLAAVGSLSI